MSRYRVLALTWRPKSFDQVVGQPHVVTSLSNAISLNKIPQCLLFTGTRGVGKTTIARILAKCLNCLEGPTATPCQSCEHCSEIDAGRFPDLYEVDAASRTKVEDTRELLDNIPYAPTKGRFKVYLIDEVHMLSTHSFNALLKTLEEPPEHVIFLLATTDPQKLPATVLSRCLQFKLQSMSPEQVDSHVRHILQQEAVSFDAEATQLIAQAANGSMRDALSLLDQSIAHGNGEVSLHSVRQMLGTIDDQPLCDILSAIAEKNGEALMTQMANLRRSGADFAVALRALSALIQDMAVTQVIGENSSRTVHAAIPALAQQFSATQTQLLYQIALKGIEDMPFAPSPDMGFEMSLLRMLAFQMEPDIASAPATQKPTAQSASAPMTRSQPATQARVRPAASRPAPAPKQTATGNANDPWSQLVTQLPVRGLTQVLAQSCQLKEKTEHSWTFTIEKKQSPVLQPRTEQALEKALSEHLGKTISIRVEITDGSTPVAAAPQAAPEVTPTTDSTDNNPISAAEKPAENPVHQNPEVQRVMQTFSGKLDDQRVVNNNN